MSATDQTSKARKERVDNYLRLKNEHDIRPLVDLFRKDGELDDRGLGQTFRRHPCIHDYYTDLMRGVPDLSLEEKRRYVSDDAIIAEVIVRGTHLGDWRGLPPTGRRLEIPVCAVFTFGADQFLGRVRIYYDRALVLKQLGVFHDPETPSGKFITMLTHPLTMADIVWRANVGR